ncbi:MAG: hypothetical protein IJ572_01220 [Bacilli bacterium]|nr:hypothetical protein [Bacilli bacterium]
MKKLNLIKEYIYMFLISLLALLLISSLIFKFTILNSNYMINLLDNNNYYELLYNDIHKEMVNNIPSSGFNETIFNNIFDINTLKNDTKKILINFYNNEETNLDTSNLKITLEGNINSYINSNNIIASNKEEITNFINLIDKIYKDNVIPTSILNNYKDKIYKLNIAIIIIIIISLINFALVLILKRKNIKNYITIPLLFCAFIYFFAFIYIKCSVDINNLIIYNDSITLLIKEIFNNLIKYLIMIAIICIELDILVELIFRNKK